MQRLFRFNDWPMRTKLIAAISGFLAIIGVVAGVILAITTANSLRSQLETQMTVLAEREGARIGDRISLETEVLELALAHQHLVHTGVDTQNASCSRGTTPNTVVAAPKATGRTRDRPAWTVAS